MTKQPGSHDFFCSDCSRAAGEQVFGSAPVAQVWLALEYTGVWTRKALVENGLPAEVSARLNAEIPGVETRPLLIRQPGRTVDGGHVLFVAVADEIAPRLYRFLLADYADLLALDLAGIVAGKARFAAHQVDEALYLVCTNGKRDRACSRDGLPVYQTLAEIAGGAAWQSTHLGGHRFAGTLLHLPHGVSYGYLTPADVGPLVRLAEAGCVDVAHLRGRTCYARPVQAAEYYLRQVTGVDVLPGFRLDAVQEVDPAHWRVSFAALEDGALHTVELAAEETVEVVLSSTDTAYSAQPQYTLVAHSIQHE